MDPADTAPLIDGAIALGLGLMIGLEREHHEVNAQGAEPPPRPVEAILGVRTFALLALLGWVCGLLGGDWPWVPPVALLVVGGMAVAAFLRTLEPRHGLTTEVAALVTFVVGLLVHQYRSLAVAVALATTVLLISKPWFKGFVPRLRRMDLTTTLQLLIVLAIVLPLLPTEARDPWGVLSPRRLGLFVTLIAGIDYVGYVLTRVLGRRRGAGLTGLVGGLASSTAVTAAMAQEARRAPSMVLPAQLATLLACSVMFGRILVVTTLISREVALQAAAPLLAMGLLTLAGAAWKWRALRAAAPADDDHGAELDLKNPFALLPVLKWGLFLALVLVAAAAGKQLLGDRGVVATAALSGLADVDAITLAVCRQTSAGGLAATTAVIAIVVAATANTLVKCGIAWVSGGRAFGADIARVFAVVLAGGAAAAAVRLLL